jgi:hypothetical protein
MPVNFIILPSSPALLFNRSNIESNFPNANERDHLRSSGKLTVQSWTMQVNSFCCMNDPNQLGEQPKCVLVCVEKRRSN